MRPGIARAQRLFSPDGMRDPEPLIVLSHGKGQQSTALGYMLHYEPWVRERFAPGRLLTISADTGSEHRETREHVRYLQAFYAAAGEHFEHVTADKGYHNERWRSLEHFYSSGERRRIGSKSFKRSCTWQLKLAHGRSNYRKDNGVKVDSVIYTIVCTANGRQYVGSALSFGVRKRIHLSDLNLGRHHSRHLQRAWDKYGAEAFRFDILERVGDPSQLTAREQHYLDLLRPAFNALAVAGSSLGFRHTPTSLAKMRAWKRKVPGPMKGRKQTPEARAKMSAAKKGHTLKVGTRHAEESKRKMSASQLFITQHNSRPVEQLAPDGAPVRRFRSIAEAARATGAHAGSIRHVLAGRARLAAGYGWRDATEPEHPPDARRAT